MQTQHFDNVFADLSLSMLEAFGDHMPGGFFVYKAYGDEELLYANDIVFDIFGCHNEEEFKQLTGNTFHGMVYDDDIKCVENSIVQQIEEDPKHLDYVEYRIRRKSGEIRWVDDYGRRVHTSNYGEVFFVLIRDITSQHIARETIADTDHLTHIYNRRHFDRELLKYTQHLTHFGGSLCMIMMDIDKFKNYNDEYGHIAGDACLTQVARAMQGRLRRKGDMLFRYGGEEFAAILPGVAVEGAVTVAENIRQAVRRCNIPHKCAPYGIVTISAGVAMLTSDDARCWNNPGVELIRRADAALYAAKEAGRDRVMVESRQQHIAA